MCVKKTMSKKIEKGHPIAGILFVFISNKSNGLVISTLETSIVIRQSNYTVLTVLS